MQDKMQDNELYEVRFYYGKSYDLAVMAKSELDAMISFVRSNNARYYKYHNQLFNICNYYKVEWMKYERRNFNTKQY